MEQKHTKSKSLLALETVLQAQLPNNTSLHFTVTDHGDRGSESKSAMAGFIDVSNGKIVRNFTKLGGRLVIQDPICW